MTGPRGAVSRVGLVFSTAVAAALTTAALHLSLRATRQLVLNEYQPVGPDAIWMAPIAEVAFFLLLASPFMLVVAFRASRLVVHAAVFVLGLFAAVFILLQTRWLYPIACLLFGAGVAWRLLAFWRAHPETAARWTHRVAAGWTLAFIAAGALRIAGTRDAGMSADGPASDEAPNVLILLLDTVGARHLSLYGYERQTSPSLDSLARESLVFDNAVAPSSWTLPSHASLFTGVPAASLSARWTRALDDEYPTMAERFAGRGYRTAGFTANLTYTIQATGIARGFQYYRADRRTLKAILLRGTFVQTRLFQQLRTAVSTRRWGVLWPPDVKIAWEIRKQPKPAGLVADEFLQWQRSLGDQPFFAFLNFFDAHHPYDPPDPWGTRFARDPTERDRHDGAIVYIDSVVGGLIDTLRQRGLLDRTILVVTSDHGEAFGEHGLTGHGNSLYREAVHVPLVLRYPSVVPAGVHHEGVVSVTDLGVTLLELADPGRPPAFPGRSLAATWGPDTTSPRATLSWVEQSTQPNEPASGGDLASATDDRYSLILSEDGDVDLYDYRRDPGEEHNLADSAEAAPAIRALRAILRAITDAWPGGRS